MSQGTPFWPGANQPIPTNGISANGSPSNMPLGLNIGQPPIAQRGPITAGQVKQTIPGTQRLPIPASIALNAAQQGVAPQQPSGASPQTKGGLPPGLAMPPNGMPNGNGATVAQQLAMLQMIAKEASKDPRMAQAMAGMSPQEKAMFNALVSMPPDTFQALAQSGIPGMTPGQMPGLMGAMNGQAMGQPQDSFLMTMSKTMMGEPKDWAIAAPAGIATAYVLDRISNPEGRFFKLLGQATNFPGLKQLNEAIYQGVYQNKNLQQPWLQELFENRAVSAMEPEYLKRAIGSFQELNGTKNVPQAYQGLVQKLNGLQTTGNFQQVTAVAEEFQQAFRAHEKAFKALEGVQKKLTRMEQLSTGSLKGLPGAARWKSNLENTIIKDLNKFIQTDMTRLNASEQQVFQQVIQKIQGNMGTQSGRDFTAIGNGVKAGLSHLDDALKAPEVKPLQMAFHSIKNFSNRISTYMKNVDVNRSIYVGAKVEANPLARGFVALTNILKSVFGGETMSFGVKATQTANEGILGAANRRLLGPAAAGIFLMAPAIHEASKAETKEEKVKLFAHRFFGGFLGNLIGWEIGKRVLPAPITHLLGDKGAKTFAKLGVPILKSIPWIRGWTLAGTAIELTAMFLFGGIFTTLGEKLSHLFLGKPKKIQDEETKKLNPNLNAPGQNPTKPQAGAAPLPGQGTTTTTPSTVTPPNQTPPVVVHRASAPLRIDPDLSPQRIAMNPLSDQYGVLSQMVNTADEPVDYRKPHDFRNNHFWDSPHSESPGV